MVDQHHRQPFDDVDRKFLVLRPRGGAIILTDSFTRSLMLIGRDGAPAWRSSLCIVERFFHQQLQTVHAASQHPEQDAFAGPGQDSFRCPEGSTEAAIAVIGDFSSWETVRSRFDLRLPSSSNSLRRGRLCCTAGVFQPDGGLAREGLQQLDIVPGIVDVRELRPQRQDPASVSFVLRGTRSLTFDFSRVSR